MSNRRVFRRHWLINLALPGLPWLIVVSLLSLAAFYLYPYSRHVLWLFALDAIPLYKLLCICLTWRSYSVSIADSSNVLVEQSGLLGGSERQIPLSQLTTVERKQAWWASLLGINVGDAVVGAMGGALVLSSMGDFSDLWIVLETKGQTFPPKRPALLIVGLILLGRGSRALIHLTFSGLFFLLSLLRSAIELLAMRSISTPSRPSPAPVGQAIQLEIGVPDNGYVYQNEPYSRRVPSYAGFCAFCQQFLLAERNWTKWRYRAIDARRPYYPDGISEPVAGFYLHVLRQACVLIPAGPDGYSRERLSCRVHSIQDIQRLVPSLPGPLSRIA